MKATRTPVCRLATAPVPSAMFEAGCATAPSTVERFRAPDASAGQPGDPGAKRLEGARPRRRQGASRQLQGVALAGTLCNEDTFWVDPGQELQALSSLPAPVPVRYTGHRTAVAHDQAQLAQRRAGCTAVLCRYAW